MALEWFMPLTRRATALPSSRLPSTAIDATGAGDAFRSGLLYGLFRGFDLPRSVCWGVAAGSLKVKNLGAATTLPDFKEIEALANSLQTQPEI